jgi:hypothetical protein
MDRVIRVERGHGSEGRRAKKLEVGVTARIQSQRARTDWRSEILFVLLTVGPWVVLVWLLWPRR